jgi:hypothetical protein
MHSTDVRPNFRTTDITLYATIGGNIWMPNCHAMKHVEMGISRTGQPFSLDWPGTFRDLLDSVSMREGGDFCHARFIEAHLRVTRRGEVGYGTITRRRWINLNMADCADFFFSEDEAAEIQDACCADAD